MSITDILERRSDTFEKLPPLPPGQYVTTVVAYEQDHVGPRQTPAVIFTLRGFAPAPMSPIATGDLSKYGDLSMREMRYTLYLTEAAAWRVRQFLDHLGIEEGDRSLGERLSEAPNKPVIVTIKHDMGKGPNAGAIFANI